MRSAAFSDIDSSTEGRRLPAFAVVLAGGSGTRLWPATSPSRPKQFLPWFGGRSLFQRTIDRVRPLFGPSRILVVCGAAHLTLVRDQAPGLSRDHIIVEETGRNTAASIALAALWIRGRMSDAAMLVCPSDHWITHPRAFRSLVRRGLAYVSGRGGLLTLGIPPETPDTGYGYINPGETETAPGIWTVRAFVEKPEAAVARRMIRTGRVYWNSGIFIWRATGLLEGLRRHRAKMLGPLEAWSGRRKTASWRVPAPILSSVEAVPIDRALLEKSREVLVMPAPMGWSDLGTWDMLSRILRRGAGRNAAIGDVLALDSRRCLAVNEGGVTVLVGLQDVVAVRSGNLMLVCGQASSRRLKEAAARIAKPVRRGPKELRS